MPEPKLKQSWNSRSKKWVLYECKKAGIKDMSPDPFPGVPVENGKPEPMEKVPAPVDESTVVRLVGVPEAVDNSEVDAVDKPDNSGGWFGYD